VAARSSAAPSSGAVARSPASVRAGLATGSQSAVVKLASYGAGIDRAGALLSYQSDKGELALEREDGSFIAGKEAVASLAAQWSVEDATRAPSNDSFAFTLKFEDGVSEDEARAALAVALKGHNYAWRLEDDAGASRLHVVTVAASRERDEAGKAQRIYANDKSVDRLRDRLDAAFGRAGAMTRQKWAHGVDGATAQLVRLTKAGEIEAHTSKGSTIAAEAERLMEKRAARRPSANRNPALELAKAWAPAMRSSSPRDFAHVILSAKPDTDKAAFMDAARATLAREFAGHEYVFVLHTNRRHIHVHAAVRLTAPTGEKLHPGIQDFHRWRQTLAEEARERNIAMEATRRFDQAHAPAYRLKDAKMIEREIAPASVRRRVERVKNREIHKPTRPEGRRHAEDVSRAWAAGDKIEAAAVLPFQQRANAALGVERPNASMEGRSARRSAETMTDARKKMEDSMERISALLPDGPLKEDFERERRELLAMSAKAVEMRTRLEKRGDKSERASSAETKLETVAARDVPRPPVTENSPKAATEEGQQAQALRHEQEKVSCEQKSLTEHQQFALRFLEQEARRAQGKEESEGEGM
jgi:hypothetical protein